MSEQDVKVLKFAPNPDFREGLDVDGALVPQFRCPVTQMDFNGVHPFVVIWPTGWVLSEKAVREIGAEGLSGEYGPFVDSDVIRCAGTHRLPISTSPLISMVPLWLQANSL